MSEKFDPDKILPQNMFFEHFDPKDIWIPFLIFLINTVDLLETSI